MDELTRFLVHQPTAVATLLAEHRDDGSGHCRACAVGGQRGFHVWPCTLYRAATAALRVADGSEPSRPLTVVDPPQAAASSALAVNARPTPASCSPVSRSFSTTRARTITTTG